MHAKCSLVLLLAVQGVVGDVAVIESDAEGFASSFDCDAERIVVGADDAAHVYASHADNTWSLEAELSLPPNVENRQHYCNAIDGHICILGSPYENGNRGAAYAYQLEDGQWSLLQRIAPPDGTTENAYFGWKMKLAGDTLVVYATQSPDHAVEGIHLYQRVEGTFKHEASHRESSIGWIRFDATDNTAWLSCLNADQLDDEPPTLRPLSRTGVGWKAQAVIHPENVTRLTAIHAVGLDGDDGVLVGVGVAQRLHAVFFQRQNDVWSQTGVMEFSNEEASPVIDVRLRSGHVLFANDLRSLVLARKTEAGWERVGTLPATPTTTYPPNGIGLTESHAVVYLGGDEEAPRRLAVVPFDEFQQLHKVIWDNLSTGEQVGTLSEQELLDLLVRVSQGRDEARSEGDEAREATLRADFQKLRQRYVWLQTNK